MEKFGVESIKNKIGGIMNCGKKSGGCNCNQKNQGCNKKATCEKEKEKKTPQKSNKILNSDKEQDNKKK